jgi:hypothetical protein
MKIAKMPSYDDRVFDQKVPNGSFWWASIIRLRLGYGESGCLHQDQVGVLWYHLISKDETVEPTILAKSDGYFRPARNASAAFRLGEWSHVLKK